MTVIQATDTLREAMFAELRANIEDTRYSIAADGEVHTSDKGATGVRVSFSGAKRAQRVRFESAKYGDAIATMPHTADALRRFARRYWFDSNI